MGLVAEPRPPPPPPQPLQHHLIGYHHPYSARRPLPGADPAGASMSRGFHQGAFSFSDGFGRSVYGTGGQQQQHIGQQSQRDKLMVQGFDPSGGPLLAIEEREEPIYETAGADNMLSDMFNLPSTGGPTTTELLANHIAASYRLHRPDAATAAPGFSGDWYGGSGQGVAVGGLTVGPPLQNQLSGLNADTSAAAMQLFLMNPPQQYHHHQQRQQAPKSPSPPSPATQNPQQPHAFQTSFFGSSSTAYGGGAPVEGQGLSLSLCTSLQQLEKAKAEELRVRDAAMYFENQQHQHQQQQQQQQLRPLELQGQPVHHGGYGASVGAVYALRHSRYARASQELLEEFCSVVRGQLKGRGKRPESSTNPNPGSASDGGDASTSGADKAGPSSSTKEAPPLSPVDRFEQQRRRAKLLSMLDEVDRRYSHYCDQMQMVVNSFDSAMGFGAATPYTALAQKAMSRHFRCLKDAIGAQLKQACGLLGEKDAVSASAITKGETPRLRLLEQSLWRQKGVHQMGMVEQEPWRPQRGLPERSVKILRAWLFEHFLHPYPSDADKHLLARKTGLSRNQVSNWFVNGRVRLWKPMVEEMYQKEAAEAMEEGKAQSPTQQQQRPEINATKGDPPHEMPSPDSRQQQQRFAPSAGAPTTLPPARPCHGGGGGDAAALLSIDALPAGELYGPDGDVGMDARGGIMGRYSAAMAGSVASRGRLGASGDVSLTLGLRHAGNVPETGRFPVRQRFEGC